MSAKPILFNPRDFDPVLETALRFPGTEESVSHYNTPSVKVKGKFMCRLHEDGDFIATHMPFEEREKYLEHYPEAFHLPEHYLKYPYVCIWIEALSRIPLQEILEKSWRSVATAKLQAEYDAGKNL